MSRTDPHRPSVIIPEDYEFRACFGMAREVDGWPVPAYGIDVTLELRARAQEEGEAFCPVHEGLNICDVCGAWFVDGAVWVHVPTGEYITLGHTCADKYEMAAAGGYGDSLRDAKKLKGRLIDRAKRRAARRASAAAAREFIRASEGLGAALRLRHDITRDLVRGLMQYGSLSDRQVELAHKLVRDAANAVTELPPVAVPVTDGRVTVRGSVLGLKMQESQYGSTLKMLVQVPLGDGAFKLWGTAPDSLCDGELKGAEVEFTARVSASDDDPCFGFFKRPTCAKRVA